MNILVVGLGLIGGSICKALKTYTGHKVYGYDKNENVVTTALETQSIDINAQKEDFKDCDVAFICLHPGIVFDFIKENMEFFYKGTIVADVCGIKGENVNELTEYADDFCVYYVGTHPMAGKEKGGFENSTAELFTKAHFIITPTKNTNPHAVSEMIKLAKEIGFNKTTITSPLEHDKIIAYTSQLAHIVSSAYVKSPTIESEAGFSAGSFKDMTRTATLNEHMWADLFLLNKEPLLYEIETLIKNLQDYHNVIQAGQKDELIEMLKTGRIIKENNLEKNK